VPGLPGLTAGTAGPGTMSGPMATNRRLPIRVGHKGADTLAPGNTRASFDAALAAGVDMIEFDVLPERGGDRLLLAHDYDHDGLEEALTLEEGLEHFSNPAFAGIELDVDLKLPGYEERVVRALHEYGVAERSLVSSTFPRSIGAVRSADPRLRVGWSVPRARRDFTASPLTAPPALALLELIRRSLPARAHRLIATGRCTAIMAHWRLVTPDLVGAVTGAGGELFVWTVDDADRIRRLADLGVTGVITNDPRLFAVLDDHDSWKQAAAG
jgi:glycerophosphoryl diester phosphodiesterase